MAAGQLAHQSGAVQGPQYAAMMISKEPELNAMAEAVRMGEEAGIQK
jgi:hypothetical protein